MSKFTLQNPTRRPTTPEPEVDPAALEAFAAGAKERRVAEGELPPWEKFDPNAKPKHNVSVRLNDYQLEMLRYLADSQEISQHKILHKQLIPVLKRMALEAFERKKSS
jgi:hypothetical protein